jgi:hypothetical protein
MNSSPENQGDDNELIVVDQPTEQFLCIEPQQTIISIPPGESFRVNVSVKPREKNFFSGMQGYINEIFLLVRDVRLARVQGKKVAISLLTKSEPVVSTRSGLEIDTSSILSPTTEHTRTTPRQKQDDLPVLILRVCI